MSSQIVQNSKFYLDGYDLSGDLNMISLDYSAELQDSTALGATSRARTGGLKDIRAAVEGFFNTSGIDIESVMFGKIGVADVPCTVSPIAGAEGDLAYLFKAISGNYKPGASIGEMLKFSADAQGSGELVRGKVLLNGTKTATGTGTAFELGAVTADQKIYAAAHILAASGSATLKLQSAPAENFASPTDRITFTAATAIGAQFATPVAGAITDTWWRFVWTISGGTPSFSLVGSAGIK